MVNYINLDLFDVEFFRIYFTFYSLLPDELDTTLPALLNETYSPTADPTDGKTDPLVIVLPVILLIVLILFAGVAWKMRQRISRCFKREGCEKSLQFL